MARAGKPSSFSGPHIVPLLRDGGTPLRFDVVAGAAFM
jgi:hypothetical protein